ncbi:flagellar export chaperone FliS [Nesterenkonia populi]|uniref:flagellar export chaperone FliS n=1 Tax=Nesterenkonia populi TaxID=1591087 RepID=UPI0011BF3193|nr:flagellar export chaperone FliS [Nesterenkonia populi]
MNQFGAFPGSASQMRAKMQREAVLSASPGKLLTMLYDRLILDLDRAEAAQHQQNWAEALEQLIHAQQILGELLSTLRTDQWSGAAQLQSLYIFCTDLLIRANVERDAAKTRQARDLLEPLRQTWHEAAAQEEGSTPAPQPSAPTAPAQPAGSGALAAAQAARGQGGLLGVA